MHGCLGPLQTLTPFMHLPGGARRARSPLLEVVIRRTAPIHCPPPTLPPAPTPPLLRLGCGSVSGGAVRDGPGPHCCARYGTAVGFVPLRSRPGRRGHTAGPPRSGWPPRPAWRRGRGGPGRKRPAPLGKRAGYSPDRTETGGGQQVGAVVVAGFAGQLDDGLAHLLGGERRAPTLQEGGDVGALPLGVGGHGGR
jgi:hypothetical protein